ncbi:hypothetical protein Bbelb_363210 [Branchiostoma belcheri]|nr:hypothetical protein Bbelb_363210 [Branchiostoma belcheri]
MAQLMAALRIQFVRQTATRGWAMSGHCRRLQCVTGNRTMFTGESNELQRSVARWTAENYRVGRSFCTEAVPPTGAQQAGRRYWDVLIAVGALSGVVGLVIDWRVRRAETRRNQLAHVNDQLAKLYGPLYGNRLAISRAYDKVLSKNIKTQKKYDDLKSYFEDARLEWQKRGWYERWRDDPSAVNRGRSLLTRWRRFLLYVIHPLDLQAEEIVRANAHLIDDSEKNAELFREFVFHVKYQTFIVAKWEDRRWVVGSRRNYGDGDFDLWSNSGMLEEDTAKFKKMLDDLENHVNETYKKLVKRQKQLMEGLEIEGKN